MFTDLLEVAGENAEVKGTYTSDYYAGTPALICNQYGEGQAWYYGTAFTEGAAKVFLEKLDVAEPYAKFVELPAECEIAVRKKGADRYLFILNYDKDSAALVLHKEGVNLYTGESILGRIEVPGYGTLVIKMNEIS